jgi:hypothetical protein
MSEKKNYGRAKTLIPLKELSKKWIDRELELKQKTKLYNDLFLHISEVTKLAGISIPYVFINLYDIMDENLTEEEKLGKMPFFYNTGVIFLFKEIFLEWNENRIKENEGDFKARRKVPVAILSKNWIDRESELKQKVKLFEEIFIYVAEAEEVAQVTKQTLRKYSYSILDDELTLEDKIGKMPALKLTSFMLLFRNVFMEWHNNRITKGF